MHNESPWVYLWKKTENNTIKSSKNSLKSSLAKQKGHQTRLDATLSKDWERGDGFKCPTEKSRAKECVYAALEKSSKKQSSKEEIILSAIMSDLVSNHGVNENHVLSKDMKKED